MAAGEGFPALYLRKGGFTIDCFDLSDDQIELFKLNALKEGVDSTIIKSSWLDLKSKTGKQYEFIMCRGNSFIYASGGWNSTEYDSKSALKLYEQTLRVFHNLLAEGGILYLDKFKDGEIDHNEKVCDVNIGSKIYSLIFQTKLYKSKKERYASMILRDIEGNEKVFPNLTYSLSEKELRETANKVGFSLRKTLFRTDRLFDIFALKKR